MDTPRRTGLMLYQTKRCLYCNHFSILELDVKALQSWQSGQHVQNAFPEFAAPQRELLITGTHPDCWNAMFADDSDEE